MTIRRHIHIAALLSGTILTSPLAIPALAAEGAGGAAPTATQLTEEIVVVARRREERLQDVPISITAISQDDLTKNNIQSILDMQQRVPSLNMFGPFRNTPLVSIRGQGGFTPGGIPSVIIYLNEIPSPTSAQAGSPGGALGGNGLFYDLDSVQVLKGPQGTLFGRNTTGGAILLQSKRPGEELGARIQLTAGNYKNREIDGAVNLPLMTDKLLARVAFNAQQRDGFTRTQATPNAPGGKDLDDANHFSTRLSVTARPAEGVENLLIADYVNSKTNGTSAILKAVNPNPLHPVNRLFPGVAARLTQQQALGIRTQVPLDVDMFSSQNRWSVTDILKWDVAENITLRNIASASQARYAQTIDGDGTVFPVFDPIRTQSIPYVTRQYTDELQLQGKSFDGVLDWTAGFFYLNQPEENNFTRHVNTTFGASRTIGFKQSEETKAVFVQGDTDLSAWLDGLSLTTGIRYTWETISRTNRDVRATGVCTSPFSDANCVLSGTKDFGAPTWTVGLNYKASPDTLFYIASRRGFRSGGFNLVGDAQVSERAYDQEYVTDVELGVKSDVSVGGIGFSNSLALYRQYYSDIQLSQVSVSAITGGPLTITKNAGTAWITGAEAATRISFDKSFELGGHLAWIDYKFKKLDPSVVLPLLVPNVPKFKFGIDATYNLPIDSSLGDFSVTANWNWQDDVYLSTINDPLSLQKAYGLLTLGASWRNVAQYPVDLSFFMTNATNKDYAIGGLPLAASVGTSTLAYGAPRMFGFRLAYRFGSEE